MWNHQINVHALMRVCVKVCLYGAAQMTGCVQAVSAQFLPVPSHGWPKTGTHTLKTHRHTMNATGKVITQSLVSL